MKKVFITTITLIILFIGAYALYVFYMNSQPVTCLDGERMDPVQGKCVDAEFRTSDSNEIDFEYVSFKIPSTILEVKLQENDKGIFTSTYVDPDFVNSKGFVSVDPQKIKYFENDIAIVPFFLNSGGTGQFAYVALMSAKTNTHFSSVFVDDRTVIKSIEMSGDKVLVDYYTRSASQSYAEEPKIPAQLVLTVESDDLLEFMRLENSTFSQIEFKSPVPQSSIKGDFMIKGAMPGFWYFEAISQYKIVDQSYKEIASGQIQALSDWMTERKVPFEFMLNTGSFGYTGKATIIIESENVQGGEEGELMVKKMKIPVVIK